MLTESSINRRARQSLGVTAGAVAALVFLSACGSKSNGNVTIGDNGSNITISNSSGSAVIGVGASLPDGFPASFPIPDGSTVTFSANQGTSGKQAFEVILSLTQDGPTALNYFVGALASAGYEVKGQSEIGSGAAYTATIGFEGNGYDGAIVLGTGIEGATSATITLGTSSST